MATNLMKYLVLIICLLSGLSMSLAWGEGLADPTRPLFGEGLGGSSYEMPAYPVVRGLQSIIMSPNRCAAIIDGKTVALGEMHGIEKLVEVTARGVVLQGKNGSRTLTIFPTVGMKINETLPRNDQVVQCKINQNKRTHIPAEQAGKKEGK